MSKKTLTELRSNLMGNILVEFYFYIPDKDISPETLGMIKLLNQDIPFNLVHVIDYHEGPIPHNKERKSQLLVKAGKLENNILALFEHKHELSEQEFQYALEDYYGLAELHFYIADWFYKNYENHLNADEAVSSIFQMQHISSKSHFEKLIKEFFPLKTSIPKKNLNTHEFVETYFQDFARKVDKIQKPIIVPKLKLPESASPSEKTTRKRKEPLLTKEDARKELLKKVFKVE